MRGHGVMQTTRHHHRVEKLSSRTIAFRAVINLDLKAIAVVLFHARQLVPPVA